MKPVSDELVKGFLMKELSIPDYQAQICTAFSRGNLGRAKNLATSEEFELVKSEVLSMVKHIHEMDIHEITLAIRRITEYKLEIDDYLDFMAIWYRDVLLFKATNDANHLTFREEIAGIRQAAFRSSYEKIELVLQALDIAKARLVANVSFELTMELLLLTVKECG
jgi:DNA polymerase-3 subunit delta'